MLTLQEYMREEAERLKLLTHTALREVKESAIRYAVGTNGAEEREEPVETVILATERRPNCDLAAKLRGIVPEIYEVGDCREPRRILDAVHQATYAAWAL
jgi:pyruvate/2-oxoglutarate dehydrogenase complex dihydrolipoamide dehydrogenase (E3) component